MITVEQINKVQEELMLTSEETEPIVLENSDEVQEIIMTTEEPETFYVHESSKFLKGKDGKSAYEIAVENGFEGTEKEWLESLMGGKGEDAVLLQVLSSNGQMFKNTQVSTTLIVEITTGSNRITCSRDMYAFFGETAKIIWQQKNIGEYEFSDIDATDKRIMDNGFIFALNVEDIELQTVFNCILDC